MKSEAECEDCKRLHHEASDAITQQLRAIARLDLARLRYESDALPSLEAVVRQTREARELAVAAYKRHRRKHAGAAGEAARA